jgi:hypothetical protein
MKVVNPIMMAGIDSEPPAQDLLASGNYVYLVHPLPERFASDDEEMEAIHKLIKSRKARNISLVSRINGPSNQSSSIQGEFCD